MRVDKRDKRRLQGITEGTSSAHCLASSSPVLFFGGNKCSGTHCSLIEREREEREGEKTVPVRSDRERN